MMLSIPLLLTSPPPRYQEAPHIPASKNYDQKYAMTEIERFGQVIVRKEDQGVFHDF